MVVLAALDLTLRKFKVTCTLATNHHTESPYSNGRSRNNPFVRLDRKMSFRRHRSSQYHPLSASKNLIKFQLTSSKPYNSL
jgi:hypothetical protein